MISFRVDTSQLKGLKIVFRGLLRRGVEEAGERGVELVKAEAPSKRIRAGTSLRMLKTRAEGHIEVSAVREATSAGVATLHLPSGKTREVATRPQKAFDFAKAVAEGTGLFGVRGTLITPRRSRVLMIPVESVAAGEAYLTLGSQKYILRPASKGMRPNPYDERAASRLLSVAPDIVEKALAPLS